MDLLSLIGALGGDLKQDDHYRSPHLGDLYRRKIARSQAVGKDGIRVSKFSEVIDAQARLIEQKVFAGTYKFTTFKERLILRGADRCPRQISIPTVRDRLLLRSLCEVLHKFAPLSMSATPHATVAGVVNAVKEQGGSSTFVRMDVRDFFPTIVHSRLIRELELQPLSPLTVSLCREAIQTPSGSTESANSRGVPQGLSISNALSQIYLSRFDQAAKIKYKYYFRYVDDILVICDAGRADATLHSLARGLRTRGLRVHPLGSTGKTEIRPVANGIDFLGYRIGAHGVAIRDSSFRRMFSNISKVVTDYRYRRDNRRLEFRLNLKITGCLVDGRRRGWMMFFSRTDDRSQLKYLDEFVKSQLDRSGFPLELRRNIKTFIKSYHEIRFRLDRTNYIPNLDNFSMEDKIDAISRLTGRSAVEIQVQDISIIEAQFSRLLSKEIYDLENDVGSFS